MTTLRESLHAMLSQGATAVLVAPETPGVVLPAHLMAQPLVQLNLSYRFGDGCGGALPIRLDEDAVRARLTFGGAIFDCVLPYACIKRGSLLKPPTCSRALAMVAEHEAQRAANAAEPAPPAEPGQVLRTKGHLRLLKGGAS